MDRTCFLVGYDVNGRKTTFLNFRNGSCRLTSSFLGLHTKRLDTLSHSWDVWTNLFCFYILAFQCFDSERTWWTLFQERVKH